MSSPARAEEGATVASGDTSTALARLVDICVCPDDYAALEARGSVLVCTGCGREYEVRSGIPLLLPSGDDDLKRRYLDNYDEIAEDDLAKPIETNRPARHAVLKRFIGNTTDQSVLDIGSSDAVYLRQIDARLKVAVDIALPYLLKIPPDSGVVAVCADAERLPVRGGVFDVVIIADVLEHVLNPERVVERLTKICRPDTRLIVHVPWEEDLSQYRDSQYEFTHLRSFNAFSFGVLFRDFYERRSRGTHPRVTSPLPYRLYGRVPRSVYNLVLYMTHHSRLHVWTDRWWTRWFADAPRGEWWLLWFYPPVYRIFELRLIQGTTRHRAAEWLRKVKNRRRAR